MLVLSFDVSVEDKYQFWNEITSSSFHIIFLDNYFCDTNLSSTIFLHNSKSEICISFTLFIFIFSSVILNVFLSSSYIEAMALALLFFCFQVIALSVFLIFDYFFLSLSVVRVLYKMSFDVFVEDKKYSWIHITS